MKALVTIVLSLFCITHELVAQAGLCLNFDGSNDYVDPNTLVTSVSNNFTYEFWARPTATHDIDIETNSTTNIAGLYGQRYAIWPTWRNYNAGVGVSVGTNGVSVYEHGSNYLTSILTWTGTLNNWTHIAVVVSNKLSSLYINGVFVKSGASTNMQNIYPSLGECGQYGPLVGGIGGGTYGFFAGDLDEVRIWSTVRTQAQIVANMNIELGCLANLLAYYKFNNGLAGGNNFGNNIAADYSGNNYNATLTNFGLNTGNLSNWIAPGAVLPNSAVSNISASPNTVLCPGSPVTLTVSPAQTILWSTGSTQSVIVVQPTSTTVYSVVANAASTCSSVASITVTVPPPISISATQNKACIGQTVGVTAVASVPYVWTPPQFSGNSIVVQPVSTTVYSVTASPFPGCNYGAAVTVSVVPTLSISASSTLVCAPQTATLTAMGAGNYTWTSPNSIANGIVVQPNATTTYTLKSNAAPGCTQTAVATLSVIGVVTVSPASATICEGQSQALVASGGSSLYVWPSGGFSTGPNQLLVSPQVSTQYIVVAQHAQCQSTAVANISVIKKITAAATHTAICVGESTQLNFSGGVFYTLLPSTSVPSSITVQPPVTTIYTISSQVTLACYFTTTVTVQVSKCVGLDKLALEKLIISPNPATDRVRLSVENTELSSFFQTAELVDAQGRVIKQLKISDTENLLEISTGELADGMYVLRLKDNKQDNVVLKKVLVQH